MRTSCAHWAPIMHHICCHCDERSFFSFPVPRHRLILSTSAATSFHCFKIRSTILLHCSQQISLPRNMSDYINTITVVAGLTTIALSLSLICVKNKAKKITEDSQTVSSHEEVEELDKEVRSATCFPLSYQFVFSSFVIEIPRRLPVNILWIPDRYSRELCP